MSLQRLKCSLLASFALLSAGAAQAADYAPPPPPMIVQQPVEEFASGWYLRGDIGMSTQSTGSLSNANYSLYDSVTNAQKGFDSAPIFGIGIGYNVNEWFRIDGTAEYRGKANFHGFDVGRKGTDFADDRYTASKSELTFLLNAYVDLGTWNCITPFVGAGIGFSRNTISDFADLSVHTIPDGFTSDVYSADTSKWSFAWALYAGLAYKVNRNLTVEFAYRYIDLGSATTGNLVAYNGIPDISYTPYTFNHLTSQDLKLGVRLTLDSSAGPASYYAPQTYAPAPVYTQPPVYQQQPVYTPPPVYQQQPAYTQPPVYQQQPAYSPPLRSRG